MSCKYCAPALGKRNEDECFEDIIETRWGEPPYDFFQGLCVGLYANTDHEKELSIEIDLNDGMRPLAYAKINYCPMCGQKL